MRSVGWKEEKLEWVNKIKGTESIQPKFYMESFLFRKGKKKW